MTAPDRIWIAPTIFSNGVDDFYLLNPEFRGNRGIEYVRADTVKAQADKLARLWAENERMTREASYHQQELDSLLKKSRIWQDRAEKAEAQLKVIEDCGTEEINTAVDLRQKLAQVRVELKAALAENERLRGLLAEAIQWNWIDFEETPTETAEACLPSLVDLNQRIVAALAQKGGEA